jgi:hypothetical protein
MGMRRRLKMKMEQMKNVRWIGLVLAMLTVGFSSCCNNPEEFHYPIPKNVLALNPYHGGSDFHMRFSGGGLVRVAAISENRNEYQLSQCGGCCATEYKDEYFIYFQADSGSIQVTVNISQTGTEGVFAPARLGITLGSNGVFYADFQSDGLCRQQDGMNCLDSLQVAGRSYYDVFEFRNHSSNQAANNPDRVYYNASDGLLKFTTYGGAYWELVQ